VAVSVCMATYNGERFLHAQVRSILDQLSPLDEIVVVDDCSTDGTSGLIGSFCDPRIRLFINDQRRREVYSFGRAIGLSRNAQIFLADQDDVWLPGRVKRMGLALERAALVTTNFEWIDADGNPLPVSVDGVRADASGKFFKNLAGIFIGKTSYFGCALAFRRDLVPLILPIPGYVESHDLWIAMAANVIGSNVHLEDPSLLKRRHDGNATATVSGRSLVSKLWSRAIFARALLELLGRRSTKSGLPTPIAEPDFRSSSPDETGCERRRS
jgi:glycosyltransferase involved in cell wall biosynthesis